MRCSSYRFLFRKHSAAGNFCRGPEIGAADSRQAAAPREATLDGRGSGAAVARGGPIRGGEFSRVFAARTAHQVASQSHEARGMGCGTGIV